MSKRKDKVKPKKKAEVKPKKKTEVTLEKKKAEFIPKKREELKCSVCGEKARRSFSSQSVEAAVKKAGLQVGGSPKRIQLCDKHYRAIKKELKKERKTERMRQGLPF